MSWDDRESAGHDRERLGRPGDWQGVRPTFDKPWTWSIPVARLAGITIRVHIVFLLYIVVMLLQSKPVGGATFFNLRLMVPAMGILFFVVLAHELGHCLACRLVGGHVDEILMWPLGGLASCDPGPRWSAHIWTALGGPLVNVALCAICASILAKLTGLWWGVAIPNPLDPMGSIRLVSGSWQQYALAMINEISLIMLLFNLLPILPLDGGRIVQAALWPRFGYSRSMLIAVNVGYCGAILLGIYGAVVREWTVVAIALFGGLICYNTQRQLQWSDSVADLEADEYALSTHGRPEPEPITSKATRRERLAERRALQEQQEAREVDRILQKIAESGMASLSRAERALLHRATERKRHER